jgi:hypothetical protein
VDDADPAKWDYPDHTRAKHDILRRYLQAWYPILSSWTVAWPSSTASPGEAATTTTSQARRSPLNDTADGEVSRSVTPEALTA